VAACFTPLHSTLLHSTQLVMYGLDATARQWKPTPWSSLRTVL